MRRKKCSKFIDNEGVSQAAVDRRPLLRVQGVDLVEEVDQLRHLRVLFRRQLLSGPELVRKAPAFVDHRHHDHLKAEVDIEQCEEVSEC